MKINFSSLKVYVNTEIQKLYNVFSPILHSHGNITSNGMIGDSNNNANKNVVTDENGQITIEEKTEGLDSFNYGYIDENLQCHLIKVEEINILSADSQLLPSEDFNLSGEIITDDETNNPIAVTVYLNNDYLETVYTYGYDKSFDFSIEDSELVSGENIIKMQCGNVVLEYTCLLSQDELTLTSDKDILSAADNDVATITATYNANDNSGKVVTFSGAEMTTTVSSEGYLPFGNEATVSNIQMSELKLIYLGRKNNCLYISRTSSTQYRIYVLRQGDTYVVNDGKIDISQGFSYSGDTFTYTNNTGTVCTFDISGLDKQLAGDSNVSFTVTSSTVSAVTDSNGVATVSYNSQGAGDVTITAECMSLQKTYTIYDWYRYDDCSTDKTSNYTKGSYTSLTFDTDHYVMSTSTDDIVDILDGVDNVQFEVLLKHNNNVGGMQIRQDPSNSNNGAVGLYNNASNTTYLALFPWSNIKSQNNVTNNSDYYRYILTINGSSVTARIENSNGTSLFSGTTSKSLSAKHFCIFNVGNNTLNIKEIVVKPIPKVDKQEIPEISDGSEL